jgi:hypothetical protein
MAFVSKLRDAPDNIYVKGAGFKLADTLNFTVLLSGHQELGKRFQGLDGAIRSSASLGARNAAGAIWWISQLQVPYDTGALQLSGTIIKGQMDDGVDYEAMTHTFGALFEGASTGGERPAHLLDEPEAEERGDLPSRSEVARKPIAEYKVEYNDEKAWFIHEASEMDFRQAGEFTTSSAGADKVPDSEGRKRGAKYLERAVDEVGPQYPDWVAAEIEAAIGRMKPAPAAKPFDGRPRLVKKST